MANWLDKYDVGGNLDPLGLATVKKDATQLAAPKLKLTKAQLEKNKAINKQVMAKTNKAKAEEVAKRTAATTKQGKAANEVLTNKEPYNIQERFRLFPNDTEYGQVFDEYFNPAYFTGQIASGLGNALQAGDYKGAATEAAMALGVGALGFDPLGSVMKTPARVAQSVESGLLSNAYKINPWAFKANPEAYYHRSPNLQNVINSETGMLQGFGESEAGRAYTDAAFQSTPGSINLKRGANTKLYFAKGTPLDFGRYNSRSLGMSGHGYPGPYLIEAEGIPMGMSTKGSTPSVNPPTGLEAYAVSRRPISANEVKFYQEDWLRGYKPIEVPNTNTSSTIANQAAPIDKKLLKDAYGFLERRQFVKDLQKKGLIGKEFTEADARYAAGSTDKTNALTKLALDREATFYRGVQGSVPENGIGYQDYTGREFNMSEPAWDTEISEFENMQNAGVDFNDPMSIAEYQATHVPMNQYGYRSGMPSIPNVDAIYATRGPNNYGKYQMRMTLPRDYSEGNYSDWVNKYFKPENNLENILYKRNNNKKDFVPNADYETPTTLSKTNRSAVVGQRGQKMFEVDKTYPYIDYRNLNDVKLAEFKEFAKKLSDDYNTGWRGQYKNGGELNKYDDGGELNYNNTSASFPPNFVGQGYDTTGRNYSPAWGGQFKDGGKVCDSCQKAQDGDKISGDEKRKKVLAKAEEVFANSANPYTIPENIVKAGGNSNYVCIQGVCGILSDSGIIPKDYYTNTKFAEKAKDLGFGRAMADINLIKPGDVVQHMSDQNEQGTRFPSHAEIFKRVNPDTGEYEFYDYFDKYNGLGGIRTYSKDELEERFNRFKNRDNSGIQAQFFSLDPEGLPKTAPQPFPYNLSNQEQEQYFDATHAANTKYYPGEAAQGPILDVPSYERSQVKHELASLFNDKDLDKKLRKELKITDQDLQKAKPLIYGIMDQETDFGNPRSPGANIKYGLKELLGSGKYSMGPAAVRYDEALSPEAKKAFGIDSPKDLSKVKNAYIGALDVLSKGSRYTDANISGHPSLEDKDAMERALYWYNNPGNIVRSDAQNFQALQKQANHLWFDSYNPSNGRLGTFEDRFDVMGRAYRSPLQMSPGSYPDKVLQQSKGLHQVIDFNDTNVLPEVQVTNYSEEPFAMGGSLPGAVGFMYARTNSPAPSNGKYAKKTKASAQDGGDFPGKWTGDLRTIWNANKSARDYNLQYTQSPNFKNLLKKQGYTPEEIKQRHQAIVDLDASRTSYNAPEYNNVNPDIFGVERLEYNPRGLGDWSSWGDIAAHEWGHVGVIGGTGPIALKPAEQKLLTDSLNWANVSTDPDARAHDVAPQENRADLVELRKALQDRKIYDSFKGGEFKQEHLDKLYRQDPEYWNRSMRLYKDKDIIKLMNTIAANNPQQGIPVAKDGGKMTYYQNGLDFEPKTISKNGSQLTKLDQLTNFTNYNTKQPGGWLDKYQD